MTLSFTPLSFLHGVSLLVTSLSFAQTPMVSSSFSEGGRTSGGGEVTISPEYLKISRQLQRGLEARAVSAHSAQMADVSHRIDSILKTGIQVRPTNEPLIWKDPDVDEPGTLVDALTIIGERKTFIHTPTWLRLTCERRYRLTLHEYLVHEKIEPSLTYAVSDVLWEDLKASKKAGLIDIDFSCENEILQEGHSDYPVAIIASEKGERISIECVESDLDHKCSTYQFFYTPRQQDFKTPIGGRVYHVQELAKLSVTDWTRDKWQNVPLFVVDQVNVLFSSAFAGGSSVGFQLFVQFNGFKKWKDQKQSKKAQAILEMATGVEVLENPESNHLFKMISAKANIFDKLLQYVSHEGAVDFAPYQDLNLGIRFLKSELDRVQYTERLSGSVLVTDANGKSKFGGMEPICAVLEKVNEHQFFVQKPQSAWRGKPDGTAFLAGGNQKSELCKVFGKLIGIEDAVPGSVHTKVTSKSVHTRGDAQMAESSSGFKVIGSLECIKK